MLGHALLLCVVGAGALYAYYTTDKVRAAFRQTTEQTLPLMERLNLLRLASVRLAARAHDDLMMLRSAEGTVTSVADMLAAQRQAFESALSDYKSLAAEAAGTVPPVADRIEESGTLVYHGATEVISLKLAEARPAEILNAEEQLAALETALFARIDEAATQASRDLHQVEWRAREALQDSHEALIFTALLLGSVALLIGGLMARSIVRPIARLREATRHIADGRWDGPVDLGCVGELAELGESFNTMVTRLQKTTGTLITTKEFLDDIIASMTDAMMVTDARGIIRRTNPAASAMLGYPQNELFGKPVQSVIGDVEVPDSVLLRDHEVLVRTLEGNFIPVSVSRAPLRRRGKRATGYLYLLRDISQRKESEENLLYIATHDLLTGLPNRTLFTDRLQQGLSRAPWHQRHVAVLLLDLDRFKMINDTFGHEAGDQLIQEVSQRLSQKVRGGDTVARFGGDEFALLFTDLADRNDAIKVTHKLIEALSTPFAVGGRELVVTGSMGISVFPDDGADAIALLRNADTALYQAKDQGKNTYRCYSPSMNARVAEGLDLEIALRQAWEQRDFQLHYQPQVDALTHRIVGIEALLRWQHPEKGAVSPMSFIPLAEETGLIVPLSNWVLETACRETKRWLDAGHGPLRVAVNVSHRQFHHGDLVNTVERILADTGLPPTALELELTEGIIMHDVSLAVDTLTALKAMGVTLAIDDFGTGYSSLSHLKRFPLDAVKVDRSFVRDIPDDQEDSAITVAIIAMAHTLRLTVVAEGVEEQAQLDFLRNHQCDIIQGYYFSKPLPHAAVSEMLIRSHAGGAVSQAM